MHLITVQAEADERLVMSVMSAAVSGSTAAGASVGTIVFKGITRAIVLPGVQLTAANGGIKVSAQSNEKVNLTVAGAAGSGSASVAGSFAVLDHECYYPVYGSGQQCSSKRKSYSSWFC